MPSKNDNRKYPRVKTFRLSVGTRFADKDNYKEVEVINLSAGGLCFLGNFVVNLNDSLVFRFPFKKKSFLLAGTVMRIKGREIGVRFTSPDEEIRDFVDHFNLEVASLFIDASKTSSKLVIPGYTYESTREKDLDNLLDIDE